MPLNRSLIYLFLISTIISSCNFPSDPDRATQSRFPRSDPSNEVFPVDALFSDFYAFLGGERRLGPAISPLIESGDQKSQYVEAGLLIYDPLGPVSDRFRLAPLGFKMGISEAPVPDPGREGTRYSNGHIIFPEFLPVYEELGGARFVGRPLTEVHHNPNKNTIEQYFENLGFYRLVDEPPGTVHLISYGVYACDFRCRYTPPSNSIPSLHVFVPEPFFSTATKLGFGFTGLTLSEPRDAGDGKVELIFENIVLVIQSEVQVERSDLELDYRLWLPEIMRQLPAESILSPDLLLPRSWIPLVVRFGSMVEALQVKPVTHTAWMPFVINNLAPSVLKITLRPIARKVGMREQPAGPERIDPLSIFIPVNRDLGYHVPTLFIAFLERYGGLEISGMPINEPISIGDGVFRQCFENLCVDFDTKLGDPDRLSLAPLGQIYKDLFYSQPEGPLETDEGGNLSVEVTESGNFVSSQEAIELRITITEDGIPLRNLEPYVIVTYPSGKQELFQPDPTNEEGNSYISLPPVNAPNATLIPYKVCLAEIGEEPICVDEHYLIWNFPE